MSLLPVAVDLAAISDMGLVRQNNEDALWFGTFLRDGRESRRIDPREGHNLFAVADGVGGAAAGEVASRMVVEAMAERIAGRVDADAGFPQIDALSGTISRAASQVNRELVTAGEHDLSRSGMATTYTAVLFRPDGALWMNAGDSRLYVQFSGELRQVSRDHTLREQTGDPSIPGNIITNCFGTARDFYIDVGTFDSHVDLFLLCSDGLSDYADWSAVERTLGEIAGPNPDARPPDEGEVLSRLESAAATLLERALSGGGGDNVSFMVGRPVYA